MDRSGYYITQPTGYKAFIPAPLPPHPKFDQAIAQVQLQHLLEHDEFLYSDEAAAIVRKTQKDG